ncbi:dihydrodipicolinate synthase family protein [uncultured Anaeromusa sp.]|uniref:dihydrodipicolinate synthase family protein n=1 Tax=uncultured Anaeromusa sp. TaxID=673273 RepID=UPI0029C78998|nr:dihydrodipicolinate synthase family protein [uncultured Anaeromusa sp.]
MFKGAITPVITVFNKQGKIDAAGNTQHINRLIDEGINGLLFLGSIGEFFALTMDEKKEFIDLVVQVTDKRVPVLIGTGGTILAEVIELTNYAQQAGADAVVVISPYYFQLGNEVLYRYYAELAKNTTMPIMIYNFPDRTSVNLDPQLVLRLAKEFPHIIGIKDTVDGISHTRKLIQLVKKERPDFCVMSGYDEYMVPNLLAGGDGVIGGLTNVIPGVFRDLLAAYEKQDFAGVAAGQAKISVLMNLYDLSSPFIAAIKGGVASQGINIETVTQEPSLALQPEQVAAIEKLVQNVNNM